MFHVGSAIHVSSYAIRKSYLIGRAKPMPGGDLKSLGLSLCLSMGMGRYQLEFEQGKG